MSKIVAIVSSPRKQSNSADIVDKMIEVAKANGNEVQRFSMNDLEKFMGCQACMACKKSGKCVRKDDIAPIIDAIFQADGVILSTPDYFGQPCAQYRLLEDRMYSFIGPNFVPFIEAGKKVAVVVTCASGVDGAVQISKNITGVMTNFFKFESVGEIVYSELQNGPAKDNEQVMAEAAEMASKL